MTETEYEGHLSDIAQMSHLQMADLWRNAPSEHPYFQDPSLYASFKERFKGLGGMTTEVSKAIGWSC